MIITRGFGEFRVLVTRGFGRVYITPYRKAIEKLSLIGQKLRLLDPEKPAVVDPKKMRLLSESEDVTLIGDDKTNLLT